MNHREFESVVMARKKLIDKTLTIKQKEYAPNGNPFHNFDTAASFDGVTPEKALWGMALKHLVSIRDLANGQYSGRTPDPEVVREKIGDAVNYLILMEGIFYRKHTNENKDKDE